MKFALLILAFALLVAFPQRQETRYSYHAWGTVRDSDNTAMRGINVCIVPAVRPINGRIPCVKTGADGSFAITVTDIPDKYKVCASTKDSPFILSPNQDPTHRVVCSETIEFPAHDDCRKVDLRFNE